MSRLRPIRRVLKWAGLVVCALIVVAWVVSQRWAVTGGGDGWWFACCGGNLEADISPACLADGWDLDVYSATFADADWDLDWPLYASGKKGGLPWTTVHVPIWMVLAGVAILTAILWCRDPRCIPPGYCRKCGYDLTSNMSGVCPECGTAISITKRH